MIPRETHTKVLAGVASVAGLLGPAEGGYGGAAEDPRVDGRAR